MQKLALVSSKKPTALEVLQLLQTLDAETLAAFAVLYGKATGPDGSLRTVS